MIYWKDRFSRHAACHFRHALLSVVKRYMILESSYIYKSSARFASSNTLYM